MRRARDQLTTFFLLALILALIACEREHRRVGESPPPAATTDGVRQSDLQPGEPQAQAAVAPALRATSLRANHGGCAGSIPARSHSLFLPSASA